MQQKTKTYIAALLLMIVTITILNMRTLIDGATLIVANIRKNINLTTLADTDVRTYNEALWLAQAGKYRESAALLEPIIHASGALNPANTLELYGDDLYALQSATGQIVAIYEQALSYGDLPRIHAKIELITSPPVTNSGSSTQSGSSDQTGSSESTPSEQQDITQKQQELQKLQNMRSTYLNQDIDPGALGDPAADKLLDTLSDGTTTEQRDW